MSGRPASRAARHSAVASSPAPEHPRHPQGEHAGHFHHPQGRRDGQSFPPQGVPDRQPRHPQGGDPAAAAEEGCPLTAEHGTGESASDVQQPRCSASGCARQQPCAPVPEPGVLRPLARALLAVAAEVHAARRDVPGAGHHRSGSGLRMGNRGLREGVHWGVRSVVRSVVRSPATLERTGSGRASSHLGAAVPPPVVNPDSMGDCA